MQTLLPNDEERPIVLELSLAVQDTFRVMDEGSGRKPWERGQLEDQPLDRQKRQMIADSFEDQIILVALQNENACNAVLRASANSILER